MAFSSCVSPDPHYRGETSIVGVVTRGGAPAEGAYIRLLDASRDFVGEIRANVNGRFVFFVAPGEWILVVLIAGAHRAEHSVKVQQGEEIEVTIDLAAAQLSA